METPLERIINNPISLRSAANRIRSRMKQGHPADSPILEILAEYSDEALVRREHAHHEQNVMRRAGFPKGD